MYQAMVGRMLITQLSWVITFAGLKSIKEDLKEACICMFRKLKSASRKSSQLYYIKCRASVVEIQKLKRSLLSV